MTAEGPFTFCECPVCEYSVVVATADLAHGAKVACTLCWSDSMHLEPMTERPALPGDKPEGPDARVRPMPRFTCSQCGKNCLSPNNDESAAANEFEAIYGIPCDPAKHAPRCDDCHKLALRERFG